MCKEWLPKRIKRYAKISAQLGPDYVTTEQFYEFSEGTARYVELMSAFKLSQLIKTKPDITEDLKELPGFTRFEKQRDRTLSYYYSNLFKGIEAGKYWYETGVAMVFLLEQVEKNWQSDAFADSQFLFGNVSRYCTEGRGHPIG